jgi:hypothetical protein
MAGGSALTAALERTRGALTPVARLAIDESTTLLTPRLTVRAHEVIDESMSAVTVKSIKVDGKAAEAMFKNVPMEEIMGQLAKVFPPGAQVALYADKILYLEAEGDIRMDAAKEVLHRHQPMPNRTDSSRRTKYKILRVDPNKREATLEEIETTTLPPPDEPL